MEREIIRKIEEYILNNDVLLQQIKLNKELEFLELNWNDLFLSDFNVYNKVIEDYEDSVITFEEVINSIRKEDKLSTLKIFFKNLRPDKFKISEIKIKQDNKLIEVIGIIRNKAQMYIRVIKTIYMCMDCGKEYLFNLNLCKNCKGLIKPIEITNSCGELLLEESQQDIPIEQRPYAIKVVVPDYLLSKYENLYCGLKVKLHCLVKKEKRKDKTKYYPYLEAVNFEEIKEDFSNIILKQEDIDLIKSEMKKSSFKEDLINSIFGDVYGLKAIKEAVLLQMIGSPKEIYNNSITNRGNLMILLVGSAGVSKSVILKRVASFYPKSRYVSCSMASGIGLIASTRKDENIGSYILEAGALPLCHKGGICCVDELDKIDEKDIGHMNTALDSLKIMVDKANIHTELACDVSVLAAMNPKYKIFDLNTSFYEQIKMPKDFLDRFDLIFAIDSITSEDTQKKITKVVLTKKKELVSIYTKNFILKYIALTKQIEPELTEESKDFIEKEYIKLTNSTKKEEGARFSTRLLTNIVRLSNSIARERLSDKTEVDDVKKGLNLLIESLSSLRLIKQIDGVISYDAVKAEEIIPKSNRDKMNVIINLLRIERDGLSYKDILDKIVFKNDLDEIIAKMLKEGIIMEPRNGTYRLTIP